MFSVKLNISLYKQLGRNKFLSSVENRSSLVYFGLSSQTRRAVSRAALSVVLVQPAPHLGAGGCRTAEPQGWGCDLALACMVRPHLTC